MQRRTPGRWRPLLVTVGVVATACSSGGGAELIAVPTTPPTTPVPEPTALVAVPEPSDGPAPTPTAPEPTRTPTPSPTPVPALDRGVTAEAVRIAVIKTDSVFGDVDLGVEARLARQNEQGGVAGREIRLVAVVDDRGDLAALQDEVRRVVDEEDVFAVVLASAVPDPSITDILADAAVPFFGWGFAPGFCEPNTWGFGFNGCLLGEVFGLEGAAVDTSSRILVDAVAGADATVAMLVSDDPSGGAARALGEQLWAERLLVTVTDSAIDAEVLDPLLSSDPDLIMLSVGLDRAIALKGLLAEAFDGVVIDDVTYLPGLLSDIPTAESLEGGYAITQFPPQEEYTEITGVIAADLEDVGGELIYSQAVSVGYWSADLLVALLEATGPELDTSTFYERVNVGGVDYQPLENGAICPLNTLDIHRSASGGAALVRVEGGIYFPAVAFTCPP